MKITRSFIDVINGNIFTKEEIVHHLPYFLFLALLALFYITNGYLAEDSVRKLNKLSNELKELRSEYITTKSDLMYKSKQSELSETIDNKGLGLKESYSPPKKIVVEKENKKESFFLTAKVQ